MSDPPTKSRPKMSQQATSQVVRARMIRQRRAIRNAVADAGIDLGRKPAAPAMAPDAGRLGAGRCASFGVTKPDRRRRAQPRPANQCAADRARPALRPSRAALSRRAAARPTTQTIQRVVARHYGVSVIDLVSTRRTQPLAFVRHIAIYLVRELTALSMPSIGRLFGDRDHTTILHAVRKVQARRERDPAFDATLKKLAAAAQPAAAG